MPRTQRVKHAGTKRKGNQAAHRDFGSALGASHSLKVENRAQGPFGVSALLDEIRNRLVSRGGRPSDAGPTIRRLVPIKVNVWHSLKEQAAYLSSHGKHISPAQLAALLVEKSLSEIEIA